MIDGKPLSIVINWDFRMSPQLKRVVGILWTNVGDIRRAIDLSTRLSSRSFSDYVVHAVHKISQKYCCQSKK
jgi:hypothetical protein